MDLLEYLRKIAEMTNGRSIEAIVFQHGRAYSPPKVARPIGIRKAPNKTCYKAAYHLALKPGATYVEGFAISNWQVPIPVQHAWVMLDSVVVETTWKEPGVAYYGIELDIQFCNKVLFETKTYGVLDPLSKTFRDKFMSHP